MFGVGFIMQMMNKHMNGNADKVFPFLPNFQRLFWKFCFHSSFGFPPYSRSTDSLCFIHNLMNYLLNEIWIKINPCFIICNRTEMNQLTRKWKSGFVVSAEELLNGKFYSKRTCSHSKVVHPLWNWNRRLY